ncbi:MAG: hypothetical protein KDD33_05505 [Bdellovibrionales bacterium]|nr:hypothetical protein [Bdellovibrionales bacterium]
MSLLKLCSQFLLALFFSFFAFQNCAPFEAMQGESIYPFTNKPNFYSDLQVVRTEVDDLKRENFVLDLAASWVLDPAQEINYTILYSTLAQRGVCNPTQGTFNNINNHIRAQCKLPVVTDLYIRLELEGPNGVSEAREFRF